MKMMKGIGMGRMSDVAVRTPDFVNFTSYTRATSPKGTISTLYPMREMCSLTGKILVVQVGDESAGRLN